MPYTTPEEYLVELKEMLEGSLIDLAKLKKEAINHDHYPTAARFRDIEYLTLKFLDRLCSTADKWSK